MERQKFEESFKEAFDQAEIIPSENSWINIELSLEKEKGLLLRRKLIRYQLLAAASLIFTLGISLSVYLINSHDRDKQLALASQLKELQALAADKEDKSRTENSISQEIRPDGLSAALKDSRAKNSTSFQETQPSTVSPRQPFASKNEGSENRTTLSGREVMESNNSRTESVVPGSTISRDQALLVGEERNTIKTVDRASLTQKRAIGVTGASSLPDVSAPVVAGNNTEAPGNKGMQNEGSRVGGYAQNKINAEGPEVAVFSSAFDRKLPSLVAIKKAEQISPSFTGRQSEIDPVQQMMARLEEREQELRQEEKEEADTKNISEKLWTSLGFSAGPFNSINSGVSSYAAANSSYAMNSIANEEAKASGIAYSMGVNVGTRLSGRWVFQGGVNYLAQSADYTQRNAVSPDLTSFKTASISAMDMISGESAPKENAIVATAPYTVNNNTRYLSIPLQAGYLIVNRAVGLQLNAGVATDLFLQNTVTGDRGLSKTSQSIGDNSAYRVFNFNGLVGTELSYKFSRHYRIALNPGVRYPLTNMYKTDDYKATRLTLDIGLRFRYIFH